MSGSRIDRRFAALRAEGRAGLVTFVSAGDPDQGCSREILAGLPEAGADIIELGMPFTDPMADGPAIQASSRRALDAGASLEVTLAMARDFRHTDNETPLVLMGYFNPIHRFGPLAFLDAAGEAGVDGFIVVDLPPEEDDELCLPACKAGFNFIRLATPTTDDARLPKVLRNTSGFVYYVSITGTTGAGAAPPDVVGTAVSRLRGHTDLPVAVGFGIRTPEGAAAVARHADAVVVGSSLVECVARHAESGEAAAAVHGLTRALAEGVRGARGSAT